MTWIGLILFEIRPNSSGRDLLFWRSLDGLLMNQTYVYRLYTAVNIFWSRLWIVQLNWILDNSQGEGILYTCIYISKYNINRKILPYHGIQVTSLIKNYLYWKSVNRGGAYKLLPSLCLSSMNLSYVNVNMINATLTWALCECFKSWPVSLTTGDVCKSVLLLCNDKRYRRHERG